MSLLEHERGSPIISHTTNWNRAIWKESIQRQEADAVEAFDLDELRRTGPPAPPRSTASSRDRRGWPKGWPTLPPSTPPRSFIRHKGGLKVVEEHIARPGGKRKDVGAFGASVTASPGSGFLPKPNHFVPGREAALGPMPAKLVKGDYPASYVFAKGNASMGVMVWPDGLSQKKDTKANRSARAPQLEGDTSKQMSATAPGGFGMASSGASKTSKGGRNASHFDRPRPPSGHKTQIAESRLEAHVNGYRPDEAFGSTSWFLAAKEAKHDGWSRDMTCGKRADSGQVFYWGC